MSNGRVSAPGGEEAVKLRLAEQYLDTIAKLGKEENEVKLTGGTLRRRTRALVGPTAESFMGRMNFDLLFLGDIRHEGVAIKWTGLCLRPHDRCHDGAVR